jgi:mannonate dehydratase
MVTIRDIRTIVTSITLPNLVVVKVETDEPGLFGVGCATFTQRYKAVVTVVDEYLKSLMVGHDVSRVEDNWRLMMQNAYWRNGPVINNAVSGVDMALWDIKGKLAGVPVYDLLGGKCREAAAIYRHATGKDINQVERSVGQLVEAGDRHVRVQFGGTPIRQLKLIEPVDAGYGGEPGAPHRPDGAIDGVYYDPDAYRRTAVETFGHIRDTFGDALHILHDVHSRLEPSQAVEFAKDVEPFRLFFLEDLLPPEQLAWFERVRSVCATPLAMGELFVHPLEWQTLIERRLIDFVRMHVSAIGGITPALKAARLSEAFGVRTAWHGPGDCSPVGHAANVHLDLACPNFGIQEFARITDDHRAVFPGCPEARDGYLYPNDSPGLGVDIDEQAAARFPPKDDVVRWTQARLPDGSLHWP